MLLDRSARLTVPGAVLPPQPAIQQFCREFDPVRARLAPDRSKCSICCQILREFQQFIKLPCLQGESYRYTRRLVRCVAKPLGWPQTVLIVYLGRAEYTSPPRPRHQVSTNPSSPYDPSSHPSACLRRHTTLPRCPACTRSADHGNRYVALGPTLQRQPRVSLCRWDGSGRGEAMGRSRGVL